MRRLRGSAAVMLLAGAAGRLLVACADGGPEAGMRRVDSPPPCPACNVVLVTFDGLRADHLGAYGYARPTSPAIDEFARQSIVFTRNTSQAASTLASVPSIHTSKFTSPDRLLEEGVLRDAETTFAERLSDAGFTTLAVIAQVYAGCRWGACAGFAHTDEDYVVPEAATRTRMRAQRMLRRHAREPFFLWLHTRHPHQPYDPPEDVFRRFYAGDPEAPDFYDPERVQLPFAQRLAGLVSHYEGAGEPAPLVGINGRRYPATPTVLRQLRAMYDGNIAVIDAQIGVLLDDLRAAGLLERTLVVLAADHGESTGERRMFDHNVVLQGVIHTPLILFAPGAEPGWSDAPVMNVDIQPTLLRLLGQPVPERIRGRDLFAPGEPERLQYAEGVKRAVLRGRYKLIGDAPERYDAAWPDRLFDVETDPREESDLAARHPEIARALRADLESIYRDHLALDASAPTTDVIEKLRELGYIE